MKKKVLERFVEQEVKNGYTRRIWVLGIRASESVRRKKIWSHGRKRYTYWVGSYMVEYYLPILDWDERQVDKFIEERGIPRNPAWDFGWSFECLCLAGTTLRKLDEIIVKTPELARWLAEKDEEIQQFRRSGPGYPTPLVKMRITLHEYIKKKLKQPRLTQFITVHEEQNKRL